MKIVSWNINSVRFRLDIVERFLTEADPDILCLQETKVIDGDFPAEMFRRLGYVHQAIHGQRMHHGVAILSRVPIEADDRLDWQANREARHVGVRLQNGVRLENVYVPAGGDVPDRTVNAKFGQKLDFVERMTRWSEELACPTLLVGDFNIAPLEADVWSHKQLLGVVSHTPIEVEALGRLQASNSWVDLGRHFVPAPARLYTWWSYRARDWAASDRGRRLDHMWATADAAAAAVSHRVFEECRGWPIAIDGTALLAIETADEGALAAFDPHGDASLLISAGRAATLKLANQREAADPAAPVLIDRAPWLDLSAATALADPQFDLAVPLKGPFRAAPIDRPDVARAAIRLARVAGLLPAFFVGGEGADVMLSLDQAEHQARAPLALSVRARLPVAGAEQAEIVAFRSPDSTDEHVALLIGRPDGEPPLVRLHSECLTGDVLGSLKCDCGPQLHAAIRAIEASGWGILLYLRQEGRGIGLVNKLRAYQLQDQGFDTVDANTRLGFQIDARDFGVAAAMLHLLGQRRIRLLTNNPAKVAGLDAAGVTVIERVALVTPSNPHNERYLVTKRDRTGHQL